MSEFDKEAERERLREKYEQEEADRASTKHMSELLLQGMTMTDRHCPECGSPLFSDGDRIFCPECEREVVEHDGEASPETQSTVESPQDDSTPPERQAAAALPAESTGDGPRADLQAALTRHASAAAAADDPRTAREHLEAAQAAIEALRAMDGR